MDPFQRLPAELIGQILRNAADFLGVDSLITVSRQARAIFQAHSCLIIQDQISLNSIASQPEIKKLLSRTDRPPSVAMNDIWPYRRSGVLLWDSWRMYSTGLVPNTSRERRPAPGGGFIEPNCDADTGDGIMCHVSLVRGCWCEAIIPLYQAASLFVK